MSDPLAHVQQALYLAEKRASDAEAEVERLREALRVLLALVEPLDWQESARQEIERARAALAGQENP
jgi:hypothetical protein